MPQLGDDYLAHSHRHGASCHSKASNLTTQSWIIFRGGRKKLTSTIVVCANESEHNSRLIVLMTLVGSILENRNSMVAYVRTLTRTTYCSPSTFSRNIENFKFLRLHKIAGLGRMHTHAMDRTNTTLVGSGCKDEDRGLSIFGGALKLKAAADLPRRDYRFFFTTFHDQEMYSWVHRLRQ